MVYKGMILPIIENGDVFFSATSAENRRKLQVLQNKGLHCALNKGIEHSSTELYTEARLHKLIHRREQHTLNFMFDSAQSVVNHKSKSTSLKTRSANKKLLKVKRPPTENFKRSLAYLGPEKCNALPERFHHTQTKLAY